MGPGLRRGDEWRAIALETPSPTRFACHLQPSGLPFPRCGRGVVSHVERLAAAAAALFVGIAEDEAGLQLVLDIVHFAAEDEQGRLGIDIDGDALVLDDLVMRL